ncbi:MAG: ABC-2 transporter permease [Oscillospiraceae bacterium]|nr:ABC-2 transporter permease [Oscillospiraceae bacterium]
MTGLVYKEWKQNRWYILSMILCGFLPLIAVLLFRSESPEHLDSLRIVGMLAGFLAAGALQIMVLRGDDRKLWGYWITAAPDGYRGFLRVKYEMIYGMILLFLLSMQMTDGLYCAVAADLGMTDAADISGIAVPLVFVQTLLRAVDIPFYYRFGSKTGSIIKMIGMVVLAIVISVALMFLMDSWDSVTALAKKLFTGYSSSLLLAGMLAAIPAVYVLSYRITCRLYLKGVEQYDK